MIAWMSEILVGSVSTPPTSIGMTRIFVGVIVVAVVGNAAEHSTAIMMAMKNKMELRSGSPSAAACRSRCSWRRCWCSLSHWVGPRPMDLVFTPAEVLAVFAGGDDHRPDRLGRRDQLAGRACSCWRST